MMKTLLVSLACALVLFIAPNASAQLTVGTGGMFTFINDDGNVEDVGDLFAEAEYQVPLGSGWLGTNIATDGDGFAGINLRWYHGNPEAAVFPGIGLGAFRLTDAHKFIGETTVLLGAELVLEMNIGMGNGTVPLTLCVGYYPAVAGEDVGMGRFGVKVAPDLLQNDEEADE